MVTTVHDGFFARPLDGFVRNAPLAEVQAAAAAAFLPTDRQVIPFTITFVQRGDTLVVFDAGNGVTPGGGDEWADDRQHGRGRHRPGPRARM